jgi:toxin-antitoxin system PIN domain toxin
VKLVDANVLLYSVNSDARHHERSRSWLDAALSGSDTVAFAWIVMLAFVRLTTTDGLFPLPLTTDEALDRVDSWLGAPPAVVLEPAPDHASVLRRLLRDSGTGGNLVNDAHLAALAIEHRCSIVSFDNDFGRFSGVEWSEPGLDQSS